MQRLARPTSPLLDVGKKHGGDRRPREEEELAWIRYKGTSILAFEHGGERVGDSGGDFSDDTGDSGGGVRSDLSTWV